MVQPGILSPFPGVQEPQMGPPGSVLLLFLLSVCSDRSGVLEEPRGQWSLHCAVIKQGMSSRQT